ncbi:MAG: hypothetical protein WAM75_21590 [Xanthobacteraceae bacterium]
MPNRGELPTPVLRARSAAKSGKPDLDTDAWTIIAFCAIGLVMTFYLALSTVGTDTVPRLMAQVPWG